MTLLCNFYMIESTDKSYWMKVTTLAMHSSSLKDSRAIPACLTPDGTSSSSAKVRDKITTESMIRDCDSIVKSRTWKFWANHAKFFFVPVLFTFILVLLTAYYNMLSKSCARTMKVMQCDFYSDVPQNSVHHCGKLEQWVSFSQHVYIIEIQGN